MVRTGRTPSLLIFWPHSAKGKWTGRRSSTVRLKSVGEHATQPIESETGLSSSSPELFTTEVSHLRTLKVLDQVFFQKMRSVLNSEELACIFPNLPQVYELHGQSACPSRTDRKHTFTFHGPFISLLFAQ